MKLRTKQTTQFLFLFVLLLISSCKKDPVVPPNPNPGGGSFAVDIGDSEIPYLVVDTKGDQILNEPKIPAELHLYIDKAEVLSTNIGIEYRGSTSYRISNKKSYGIETWDADGNDIDLSFFGFPEEEDWIINGHIVNLQDKYIFDRTLMYHYLGYQLFRDMGRYASRSKFVELEINGSYQGVYVFMEKLKRDNNRIDIKSLKPTDEDPDKITGGYILKIDKTAGGDLAIDQPLDYFDNNWQDDARYTPDISFRSRYDINGQPIDFEPYGPPYHSNQYLETYFLYEYPAADEITTAQKDYIQDYIDQFETALLTDDFNTDTRTYLNYIDLSSFVDFFIINELCRNVDGYRLSTYMYKDRGEKLKMGPIWDLNIGYDTGDRIPWDGWVINYNQYVSNDAWMLPFWWPRLMEDPQFRSALKDRWNELRAGTLSTSRILGIVDQTAGYLKDNGAISRNYTKWDIGTPVDYDGAIESLKNFLQVRTQWMDEQIGSF
ncbi:MAG: CotH kinase family protein [Saprospiraceae bacterium]